LDPELPVALDELVEPLARGDPESPLRIPVIVSARSGIVSSDSDDREHAVGAKRR
jgi:hypothetical protein